MHFKSGSELPILGVLFVLLESIGYALGPAGVYTAILSAAILMSSLMFGVSLYGKLLLVYLSTMFGEWTYVLPETQAYTFYGLRIFGVSISSMFVAAAVCGYFIIKPNLKFIVIIILLAIFVMFGFLINLDNHKALVLRDLNFYVQTAVVLTLVAYAGFKMHSIILCRLGIISLIFNLILGNFFDYGGGNLYLAQSSITFLFPIFLAAAWPYSRAEVSLYFLIYCVLIISGYIFLGGKFFIFAIFAAAFVFVRSKILGKSIAFFGLIFLVFAVPALLVDPIALYKLRQFNSLLDPVSLLATHTSAGNVMAELYIWALQLDVDPKAFWFGQGLGGGLADYNGLLSPWVGTGGYDWVQGDLNSYNRLHLTLTNFVMRFGILGLIVPLVWILNYRRSINKSSFIFLFIPVISTVADANVHTLAACCLLCCSSSLRNRNARNL